MRKYTDAHVDENKVKLCQYMPYINSVYVHEYSRSRGMSQRKLIGIIIGSKRIGFKSNDSFTQRIKTF